MNERMSREIELTFLEAVKDARIAFTSNQLTSTSSAVYLYQVFQLTVAAESGDLDRLRELLARDIDVNAKDKGGCTALYWAFHSNQVEIAHHLMQQGATTDMIGSLICRAVRKNHTKVLETLIRKFDGMKYILGCFLAKVCQNFDKLFNIAVQQGFNINTRYDASGHTMLMICVSWCQNPHASRRFLESYIKMLLALGADKTIKNHAGEDALAMAKSRWDLIYWNQPIIELLQ